MRTHYGTRSGPDQKDHVAVPNEQQYRQLVEEQLRAAGFVEPPVSIEAFAAHLGVPVRTFALPLWCTAALIYEDGLPAILVNSARPAAVQRAGLGHVLGHIVEVTAVPGAHYPRDTQQEHPVAEFISLEIETPAFMVRDQAQKWFNDYRYLAGLFGVTEARMFETMRDLGLIKSKGVVWEY